VGGENGIEKTPVSQVPHRSDPCVGSRTTKIGGVPSSSMDTLWATVELPCSIHFVDLGDERIEGVHGGWDVDFHLVTSSSRLDDEPSQQLVSP
jgi:hypothetical protein